MKIRPTSDHDRQRLKGASDRSTKSAGGVSILSRQTLVEAPRLSKYNDRWSDTNFMPIDVAVDCDMLAGAPIILSAMASTLGYSVVPLASDAVKYAPELVGSLIREAGEASAVILEAMADGKLTEAERNQIVKELDEASSALWKLRASLLEA